MTANERLPSLDPQHLQSGSQPGAPTAPLPPYTRSLAWEEGAWEEEAASQEFIVIGDPMDLLPSYHAKEYYSTLKRRNFDTHYHRNVLLIIKSF